MLKTLQTHRRSWAALVGAVALSACLAFGLAGCSSNEEAASSDPAASTQQSADQSTEADTVTFTDDLGRTVELPATIDRICPSGFTAQQVLLTIAPDKMVGLAQELTDDQLKIFGQKFADYPVFGAVLGATDNLNREAVAAANPQVIIDTGEAKEGAEDDLNALQEQLGIPVVFIEAKLSDYGAAYARLGELLGMESRGDQLSQYCTDIYQKVETVMAGIPESERVHMAYLLGENGLNAIAKTSFQGAVVDMVADNVVVVEEASGKGTGNEVSLEQIALWNPDLIIFQEGSIYDTVGDNPAWAGIAAIDNDNYYQVPNDPWCWMNNPPTVNQLMGLQWLPRLLYPDKFDDTIADVTREYYHLMYNYDLTDGELNDLIEDAIPRAASN
ncbi:ABC transporter substrate-binding protein [Adlercreutzia equolifaciens]|uniref:ABC transporter substrate-binding protein n=1 Tax=Adlercreutzia equolifaciens TaxID=446660 RepID=UPI0023B1770C|nr:ABC transporter substrate-binding protein [Adlercreutzia equolifaciens]MDE8701713.1 ABC transporter substrate-binding protein [Adlercreutzia equolifaciens]